MKLNGSLNLSDNMLSEIQTFNAMLRDLSRMQEKTYKEDSEIMIAKIAK